MEREVECELGAAKAGGEWGAGLSSCIVDKTYKRVCLRDIRYMAWNQSVVSMWSSLFSSFSADIINYIQGFCKESIRGASLMLSSSCGAPIG